MPNPYDIMELEGMARLPKSGEVVSRLRKYSLKRNHRIQKEIQTYSSLYPQYMSLKSQSKSMRLDAESSHIAHTSSVRLSSSHKLQEFMEKMRSKKQKQKQALHVCMNNYQISVGQCTEIAKNSYTERSNKSRAKTRRYEMPRIQPLGAAKQKQNKKNSKLQKLYLQETSSPNPSHFRVHTILMDKSKYQKLNELIQVGQFSSRTINLLKSIKAQNV